VFSLNYDMYSVWIGLMGSSICVQAEFKFILHWQATELISCSVMYDIGQRTPKILNYAYNYS